jgi:hypothetical protein
MSERLDELGLVPVASAQPEFAQFVARESARLRQLALRAAGTAHP